MTAVLLADAARALGMKPTTLRRWCREGCPHVRGRRGRGHASLVDPDEVKRWRSASTSDAVVLAIAAEMPHVLAAATVEAWQHADGGDKRRLAGMFAAAWYLGTCATLDALRRHCAAVPEPTQIPEPIERLRKIARDR